MAPTHPTSLGASGQGCPRVPGPLSRALLNSRHEVGGGQGPRHCLASELRGLGNPRSWASWGGHVWVRHGPGRSLPAAPPALWGATHAIVGAAAVPALPYRAVICGTEVRRVEKRCPWFSWLPDPQVLAEPPLPFLWGCWGARPSPGPTPPPPPPGGGGG